MGNIDVGPLLEHLTLVHDSLGRLGDGQTTILHRLDSMSSHPAAVHVNHVAQDTTIAEINLRLDRIERRLDLREEA